MARGKLAGERENQIGWDTLTGPQRALAAVFRLKDSVTNGGFQGFFYCPAGDHCGDTLAGLKAIGAERTRDLLRKAMSLFGANGPVREAKGRRLELARLLRKQADVFRPLDRVFY